MPCSTGRRGGEGTRFGLDGLLRPRHELVMLDFLRRKLPGRTVEVGWLLDTDQAGFIWPAPEKFAREAPTGLHAKSVRYCPAAHDHESRIFVVACPIDVHLKFAFDPKTKEPKLINAAGDQSTVRSKQLNQLIALVGRKEWRDPERPIVQIRTPYVFVADEPVYLAQLPPFCNYNAKPWHGTLIAGRMPINIWPRHLMWAFEWHDPSQDLVLKRGDPWFYVRFETVDPSRPVRLIEAEMTPELREYLRGLSAVTNYVNRTFSLFNVARQRRPKSLLTPKRR